MKLSEAQILSIKNQVDKSNLMMTSLRDDLFDHICCDIENRLQEGKPFEEALLEAIDELAPHGLQALEKETILLLESKNIVMKKLMYLLGLLTSICWTIGFTFRILQMPGGLELSNIGFLTFTFVFLPMLAFNIFQQKIKRSTPEKLRLFFGFTSAIVTAIAIVFKMMHFPWVDILLLTGMVVFSFGFLPFLFYTMYVKSKQLSA